MKKSFPIFFASMAVVSFLLIANTTFASQCAIQHPDTSSTATPQPMVAGHPDVAKSLVPCGQYPDCQCQLTDFFIMLLNIYNFAVIYLAFPIAAFCIVLGGVLYVLSGGNPALAGTAKKVLLGAAIGLALVLCSWLIINVVFQVLGYPLPWSKF